MGDRLIASELEAPACFQRLDRSRGLSQSVVTCFLQDRDGFIWLGTQDGLNRYDGHSFKIYRPEPGKAYGMSHSEVTALLQDGSGKLWLGSNGGGLSYFEPSTERFVRIPLTEGSSSPLRDQVQALALEPAAIWVGTRDGLGRFSFADRRWNWLGWSELKIMSTGACDVRALHIDRQGRLWVGTAQGLALWEKGQGQPVNWLVPNHPLRREAIYSLQSGKSDELLLSTDSGPYCLKPGKKSWQLLGAQSQESLPIRLRALLRDRSGNYWAASQGLGLFRLRETAVDWEQFVQDPTDPDSLAHNELLSLYEDRGGLVWIGTYGGGASLYDPLSENFRHWRGVGSRGPALSSKDISAIAVDREGWLWIGSTAGIDGFHASSGQRRNFHYDPKDPSSLGPGTIGAIREDRQGRIWVGTLGGGLHLMLDKERGGFRSFRELQSGLGSDQIRALELDPDGRLWVGTMGGGLSRVDPKSGKVERFQHRAEDPASISHDQVYCLLSDRSGVLWAGTIGGGLNRLGPTGFARFLNKSDDPGSISDNQVTALHQDRDGRLWVGTFGGGIHLFDPISGRFQAFGVADGLPSPSVYGILEVGESLWLSTNGGIAQLNRKTGRLQKLGRAAGLLEDEFNGGAFALGPGGECLFGGINGLVAFYPERLKLERDLPPIVVTQMLSDRPLQLVKSVSENEIADKDGGPRETRLVPSGEWLEIEFAALDFADPDGYRYEYKMGGYRDEWVSLPQERRKAQFYQLSPGSYSFQVRAQKDGGETLHSQVWSLIVPTPMVFWLYQAAAMLLVAGAVYAWWRLGRRRRQNLKRMDERLEQLDLLKDRILANTSHELRTPLNGIIGLAESLLEGSAGALNPVLRSNLEMIVANGIRLTAMVENLLDFAELRRRKILLNPRPLALWDAVEDAIEFFRSEAEQKGLWLFNAVSSHLPPVMADEARFQQILCSLLANGIRQTESGKISVEAEQKAEWIEIQVKDSGAPIDEKMAEKLFEPFSTIEHKMGLMVEGQGTNLDLAVAKQLVEILGGQIGFKRLEEKGNCLWFTLPIAKPKAAQAQLFHSEDGEWRIEPERGKVARILVVDDEPVNRQVLVNYLSLNHYETFEADGSESAAEMMNRIGRVDLILLDIMMPVVSGLDFCRDLRKRLSVNDLPIIFITAKNRPEDLVEAFAAGANDYVSKPISKSELLSRVEVQLRMLDLHRNLERMVSERTVELEERNRELAETNVKLAGLNRQLEETVLLDPLTGLHNRRFFLKFVPREVAGVLRVLQAALRNKAPRPEGSDLLFIMVDIDHFKSINDQYGHEAGDRVLVQFAGILNQVFRESDMLLRWGGEEFLVVSRATDSAQAPNLVERLRQMVEDTRFDLGMGQSLQRTCSIGYAPFPFFEQEPQALNWEQVVNLADRALYAAKKTRRNAWVGLKGVGDMEPPQAEALLEYLSDYVSQGKVQVLQSFSKEQPLVL